MTNFLFIISNTANITDDANSMMIAYDAKFARVGSAVIIMPTNPTKVAMILGRVTFSLRKMKARIRVNIGIVKLMVITVESGNFVKEKQYIVIPMDNNAARAIWIVGYLVKKDRRPSRSTMHGNIEIVANK